MQYNVDKLKIEDQILQGNLIKNTPNTFQTSRACHRLKYFVAKMVDFENCIAVPDLIGDEKRKRKIPPFADQKTIIDGAP